MKNRKNKISFSIVVLLICVVLGSCNEQKNTTTSASTPVPRTNTSPTVPVSSSPIPEPAQESAPQPDPFQEALNAGMDAAKFASIAQDEADWKTVVDLWLKAVQLLEKVPKDHKDYTLAQQKLIEYKKNADLTKNKVQKVAEGNNQLVSASSPSSPDSTASQSQPKAVPSQPKPQQQEMPVDMAKQLLNTWINAITKEGDDGTRYWCSQYAILQSSLFAPRKVEILDYFTSGDIARVKLRIESSNKGGQAIIADWSLGMTKEEDAERAKQLPGGWCIADLSNYN